MTTSSAVFKPPSSSGRFISLLPSLLPDSWIVLRASGQGNETVLQDCGPVEIRRTEGGYAAQTRAKGQREQAFATALQRFRRFLLRNHHSGIALRLRRPLVQSEEAPGRWLVRIGLQGAAAGIISPASRGGRVKLIVVPDETIAVMRLSGRATPSAVQRGAEDIRRLLAATPWEAAGAPMARLHTPFSALPFLGHFEIAVPVLKRASVAGELPVH